MVIQSTKDIPITKISPLKFEQILSKQIKPTTTKKLTNRKILIEVKKKKKNTCRRNPKMENFQQH